MKEAKSSHASAVSLTDKAANAAVSFTLSAVLIALGMLRLLTFATRSVIWAVSPLTMTVKLQLSCWFAEFIAVQFTVVVPVGKVYGDVTVVPVPAMTQTVLTEHGPVAVTENLTDAPLGEVAGTGETVGQVMTGGVQGTTMPLCVPVMLEFDSSVAVRL